MSKLFAGFGRVDYTPDREVPLNSVRRSAVVDSPLMVTCVALGDGEETVLIFSNDLRGVPAYFVSEAKKCVEEATGIAKDRMILCATHNHTAPDVGYHTTEPIGDWLERIALPAVAQAARDALADLTPCTLLQGKTEVPKVAYTRRYFREDGAFHGIHVIKTSDAPIVRHETEADPELRVVRLAREGKKDILLTNFQVHAATALTVAPMLSADFIHELREVVEKEEDVLLVYLQGGCGNSNTFSKLDPDAPNKDFALAGRRLAEGVLRILPHLTPAESGRLVLCHGAYEATVNHGKSHMAPLATELFQKISREGIESEKEKRELFQANGFASRYEGTAIIRRSKLGSTASLPLAAVAFGQIGLTFATGEFFDEVFRSLRKASPFPMTLTVGYSLTGGTYMPSALGFFHGGYEPLQCNYIPGTCECCAMELVSMLQDLKEKTK